MCVCMCVVIDRNAWGVILMHVGVILMCVGMS